MADAIDKVLRTFEGLIRRSIAPSVTFFVLLAAGELIAAELTGRGVYSVWRGWGRLLGQAVLAQSTGFCATVHSWSSSGSATLCRSVQQPSSTTR